MRRLLLAVIIFFSALLQATVMPRFKIFNLTVDLLLICVVITNLYLPFRLALVFSICTGILKDVFLAHSFGINTVLFALWSFIIVKTGEKVSLENDAVIFAMMFAVSFLDNLLTGLILVYLGKSPALGHYLRILFISPILTSLIFPIILKGFRRLSAFKVQAF